jgi:peptidoglycan/xylan/chitin deacetylase (PgdA/CDA1 family)
MRRALVWHGSRSRSQVALTFDDGPDPDYTPAILDILASVDATATFFLLGQKIEAHPELVDAIVAGGHELGIHGYDHSSTDLPGQTERTAGLLARHQARTHWFRPPRGQLPPLCFAWMLRHGYGTVMWSFDSFDAGRQMGWKNGPIDYGAIEGGDIVLFHDDNEFCRADLPLVFDHLERRGLRAVSISTLLGGQR